MFCERRVLCKIVDDALIFAQAVHPTKASKWLIPAHVPAPLHWTLAEVRWATLTIHFYDSFSADGAYARVVEQRVRGLLDLAQEAFSLAYGAADWTWVKEKARPYCSREIWP